jgi:TonB-linked SusC/RagA family outer membrane protein
MTNLKKAFGCLFLFFITAASAFAQVSVSVNGTSIKQIIRQIEKSSGYSFFYSDDALDLDRKITVDIKNEGIEAALNKVFAGTNIRYDIKENKQILLTSEKNEMSAIQTSKKYSGIVTDADSSEPIIGTSIAVKGTGTGTVTDMDGKFSIEAPAGSTLSISNIGYVAQEIKLGEIPNLQITMRENLQQLDEIVVVGYGTMQRKNFTGSVSTINMANSPVALSPRTNTFDALRGTVTGITVARERATGSEPDIVVHGQKSINGSSAPLIVLDGVVYTGDINDINPSVIESISLLKDATSLATYGSQAANGVVMITTKKGVLGKPMINFDASVSFSEAAMMPKLLSPEDYILKTNMAKGIDDPSGWAPTVIYENIQAGKTTDWIDLVTQTGVLQNYSVSISGASEKFNYYINAGHTDHQGIVFGDQYKRETVTLRLQNDITSWLQVGAQANFRYADYGDGSDVALLRPYLSPYAQAFRPNGQLERWTDGFAQDRGGHLENPLWNTSKGGTVDSLNRREAFFMKGHALIKAPWVTGLTFRINASYTSNYQKKDGFIYEGNYVPGGDYRDDSRYSSETLSRYLSNANGKNIRNSNSSYVWDNILNYTVQSGKHFVDISAVYTRDEYKSDDREMSAQDFTAIGNTLLGADGLVMGSVYNLSVGKIRKANIGYLGRIVYAYNDRYHLTASVRRDGSSVFGEDHKWGVFPAAGIAWTVSNEDFMKQIRLINYLKLKASWGKNGNQSLSPYQTLSPIKLGQAGSHSIVLDNSGTVSWGQYISSIGNTTLGWESTTAVNAGLDIGLLNNRIRFEIDVYKSQTTDQIFNRTIPVMANGFTRTQATMGQVDNTGVEFTLNTVNVKSVTFKWFSMLNFYLNRNKLVDLYGDGKDDKGNSLFIGKSLGAIFGYQVIGIVQQEDTDYMTANGANPGDAKFANINGSEDGKITMSNDDEADDRTILGYTKENFRMNMSHTFSYKDFELYAMFTGVFGGNGYGLEANTPAFLTNSDYYTNIDHIWWTPENRSNTYPSPLYAGTNYKPVQSYAFVRLQDLSLSYIFHQKVLKDKGVNNLRVYASVKNLFTLTDWAGGDPENHQQFGSYSSVNTYPLQRSISLGFNLSF